MQENGTLRLVGIQMVSGVAAGIIAVAGVAVMWGSIQTRLDRAIGDIETLTRSVYTQRDAALELEPMRNWIERLSRQVEAHERRIIRIEADDLRAKRPWTGGPDQGADR